jgi:hypothetical protein
MKANTDQHKQYLIDSIHGMQAFVTRLEHKVETQGETMNEISLASIRGVVQRKNANISEFKQLLKDQYNYTF